MAEPSDQDIQQIRSITDCNEEVARRWLKVKSNNADAVVNAIFDNEDLVAAEGAVTWTESAFTADREGNTTYGPQNYSFNDDNLHPLGQSAAPTRGSSPVPSLRQPSTRAEEDAEMQKAIAASQQDQDVGILSGGTFGPATKDHYDPSKWAVATLSGRPNSNNASEVIPDLEPHDRRNQPGEPRFLKHLANSGDYLPNLLTIVHSIPLARRVLLMPHNLYSSYGSDSEWWKGHAISLPRIVSTVSGSLVEPATTERDDIIAEMQRLVALLDESTRSYGSADSLVRLATSPSSDDSEVIPESMLDRVLQAWETAAKSAAPEHSTEFEVFHSLIGTTSKDGLGSPNMWSLPLTVKAESEPTVSLAEVMDNALWDMDPDDSAFCDNYMERCAPVLSMRVTQSDSSRESLGVVIPSYFFVDKYLKENVDATRDIRKQMAQSKKKIDKISAVQFKLENFKHPRKETYLDASALMKHAVNYFSGESRKAFAAERESNGAGGEIDVAPQPEHHSAIAEQLSAVCKDIKSKLEALKAEKDKARKLLSQLSQTAPLQLSSSFLKHRYSLRGVATKPHVTYLLRPRDVNDNDMIDDDEDAPEGMQWWRIEYDVQVNGAKAMKTKSTQDDVIRAVELEHNQALLVYASDDAISDDAQAKLPRVLKDFIHLDDENFGAELQTNGYGNVTVFSQIEPHQRRASEDSTIVNYAEDDEPPPYNDFNINVGDRKDALMGEDTPPAHEIKLDDVRPEGGGVEMVEKAHAPLYSLANGLHENGSDDTMADVGQVEELDSKGKLDQEARQA